MKKNTLLVNVARTTTHRIQILLLPGLGGDHRMVGPQLTLPYSVISHDLIEMHDTETISEYAVRFLHHLKKEKIIDASRPLFLGGFSFGSAVAREMSCLTHCDGLIMIGGLTNGNEFRDGVRYIGLNVIRHVPNFVFDAMTPVIRIFLRRYTKLTKMDVELCIDMYRNFSRRLFRNAYSSAATWSGCHTNVPMLRIHGAEDHIIRPPNESQKIGEEIILVATAKHLVNFSHAHAVNRAVEDFVDRTMRGAN